MMELEAQLKRIFSETVGKTRWQKGFDDCQAGRPATSPDDEYNQGYGYAFELGEKQSARQSKVTA